MMAALAGRRARDAVHDRRSSSRDGCRRWRECSRQSGWRARPSDYAGSARVAAALQQQIARLLVETLRHVKRAVPSEQLCLGGSLFYHSSINSVVRQSGLFERVFVPANPRERRSRRGRGKAAGRPRTRAALRIHGTVLRSRRDQVDARQLQAALRLDGRGKHRRAGRAPSPAGPARRMVRGPDGVGTSSAWGRAPSSRAHSRRTCSRTSTGSSSVGNRGVGMRSARSRTRAQQHFAGPDEAPFMECDYRPLDVERFRSVMPSDSAHVRLHVVAENGPRRFDRCSRPSARQPAFHAW